MPARKDRRTRRIVLIICVAGGALLTLIGIRYFLVPQSAARTFGVPDRSEGFELHYIVGLRNVWLGLLAVAFAAQREWRALALWFTAAVVVCFADGLIAATSTGSVPQVAFHLGCGIASAVLAVLCWRASPANTLGHPQTGDFAALRGSFAAFQRWRQAPDRPL